MNSHTVAHSFIHSFTRRIKTKLIKKNTLIFIYLFVCLRHIIHIYTLLVRIEDI